MSMVAQWLRCKTGGSYVADVISCHRLYSCAMLVLRCFVARSRKGYKSGAPGVVLDYSEAYDNHVVINVNDF